MGNVAHDKNHLAIAIGITEWMDRESLCIGGVARRLDITINRAVAAILGIDWEPTMLHIAKIEAAIGEDIFEINFNDKANNKPKS